MGKEILRPPAITIEMKMVLIKKVEDVIHALEIDSQAAKGKFKNDLKRMIPKFEKVKEKLNKIQTVNTN